MSIQRIAIGIQRKPNGIQRTAQTIVPVPTEAPGVPTFVLAGRDNTITLRIFRPTTGGRPSAYEYRIRRRNTGDTGWAAPRPWIETTSRTVLITQYSTTIAIANGERYQIQVRAKNSIGTGTASAYMEVTPVVTPSLSATFYADTLFLIGQQYRVELDSGVLNKGTFDITWQLTKPAALVNMDIGAGNVLLLSTTDSANVPAGTYTYTLVALIGEEIIGSVEVELTILAMPRIRTEFYAPIIATRPDGFSIDLNEGVENREPFTLRWTQANRSGTENPPAQRTLNNGVFSMSNAQVAAVANGTYSVRFLLFVSHTTLGNVSISPNEVVLMITIRTAPSQRQRSGLVDERGYFLTNDRNESLEGE